MNDNLLKSFAEAVIPYILPYVENKIKDELSEASLKQSDEVELLTKKQVIQKFQISETTLWRWEQSAKLIPHRIGSKVMYKKEDVLKAIR